MGNNQSNENRNTRKRMALTKPKFKKDAWLFKGEFVRKETYESFIRFYSDNYLVYKDGEYKYIDLANCFPFNEMDGPSLLDTNYICNYNHTKTFSADEFGDLMGMTESIVVWEDSDGSFRDSGGSIIKDTLELVTSIGETVEERQRFIASVEQSRYASNHAWTKQTSWDMPPGWK